MSSSIRWKFLINDTRSRVYLLWAIIVTGGFIATHYFQRKEINPVWTLLSLVGLGYMAYVMPLKIRQMRRILLAWLVPITFGMIISGLAFRVDSLAGVIPYLGVFWLVVMAAGYTWNGLVDPPGFWYWFAAGLNIIAALLCYFFEPFTLQQYLVAAVISGWSMLYLWLLRT